MKRDEIINEDLLKEGLINPDALLNKKEKSYMILYFATEPVSKEEEKSWHVAVGREEAYNFIKGMISCIDLESTKVVVGGTTYEDAKNAYQFMKYISQFMNDPTFNIDEYYTPDEDEKGE